MEADLVDPEGLPAVVDPEVRMHVEPPRLARFQEELFRQGAGQRRLAQALLTDQAVGMRQAAAAALRLEESARPGVSQHSLEAEAGAGSGRGRTDFARWHRAHLNNNLFDLAGRAHLS